MCSSLGFRKVTVISMNNGLGEGEIIGGTTS